MQTLVVQATDYGVWGDVMREQKSDESVYRFGYQGQFAELDEETGWSHFQLREYDAVIGRWMVVDPYRQYSSPYNGNGNNPVMNIDPSGGENPIYSSKGEFRGVDEFGLQGPAIIYDGEFTNGMSQIEILGNGGIWFDLYQFDYNNWAVQGKIYQHLRSLPARPDWDGFVTISEGVAWAKAHPGALQNPTADNMLYVNSATLDFGGLSESDFPELNKPTDLNLFNWSGTACNGRCRATTYALGAVRMIHYGLGKVSIVNDAATDYDWNTGGAFKRRVAINTERALKGLDDSHGFKVFYYGFGQLNK